MTTLETQTIREEINERIKLGVPIEAIIGDLKERGIDIFELNQAEVALEYEENTNDIEQALLEIQTAKRKYNRALLGILICSVIILITLSVNRIPILAIILLLSLITSAHKQSGILKEWEKYLLEINEYYAAQKAGEA